MIDALRAGAGPAGRSAASCLARAGRNVLALEGDPWAGLRARWGQSVLHRPPAAYPEAPAAGGVVAAMVIDQELLRNE